MKAGKKCCRTSAPAPDPGMPLRLSDTTTPQQQYRVRVFPAPPPLLYPV